MARALALHHAVEPAESFRYTLGRSLLAASVLEPLAELGGAAGSPLAEQTGAWSVTLPSGGRGEQWCDVETGRVA